MITAYNFRLFPSKTQRKEFLRQLAVHCELYNLCLTERISLYESDGISVKCYDQMKCNVPPLKGKANSASMQQTVRRLDKTYKKFFKDKKGFARFKKRFRTIQYGKYGDGIKLNVDRGLVYVQMIGNIPCKFHRTIEGKIKNASVTLKQGQMYVNVTVERESVHKLVLERAVGIDFGMKSCVTTSEGKHYETPQFRKSKAKDISRLQRKKLAEPENSKPINKAIAKCYTKVERRRNDYNHKLSRSLVNDYDILCLEDIKVKGMIEGSNKHAVNRRWADLAISDLKSKIIYKAENAGKIVILVEPAYTTQTCSQCGNVAKQELDQRTYQCSKCGMELDRDENAATNILVNGLLKYNKNSLGLQTLGQNPKSLRINSEE